MRSLVRFSVLSMVVGFVSVASAQTSPVDPDPITIEQFTANGTGCPVGSVTTAELSIPASATTPDVHQLSVSYSDFVAQKGPGVQPSDERKNCRLTFVLHVPQGYTFAFLDVEHGGYAQVDPGLVAKQDAVYSVQGQPQINHIKKDTALKGTIGGVDYVSGDGWVRDDNFILAAGPIWAKCGVSAIAHVDQEVSITVDDITHPPPATAKGQITQDYSDLNLTTIFRWQWKKC
jgi:hypothetical protein